MSGKSFMNGGGESYNGVVPAKRKNKSVRAPAEATGAAARNFRSEPGKIIILAVIESQSHHREVSSWL